MRLATSEGSFSDLALLFCGFFLRLAFSKVLSGMILSKRSRVLKGIQAEGVVLYQLKSNRATGLQKSQASGMGEGALGH